MQTQIQAQSIGKLLDTTLRLYRANFWPITHAMALIIGPSLLIQILFPNTAIWIIIDILIIYPVLFGVGSAIAIDLYHDRPWTIRGAYQQTIRQYLAIISSMAALALTIIIPCIISLLPIILIGFLPSSIQAIAFVTIIILLYINVLFL